MLPYLKFIVFAGLCLLLSLPAQADDDDVALIGVALPLTNTFEPSIRFAKSVAGAVQMAVDAANQQNIRINGRPITFKVVTQDDRSDLRTAALVAEYLVKRGVVGVIGHGSTGNSMAAAPVYAKAGIPLLAPSASGRSYTQQGFPTSFRLLGHSDTGGGYLGAYVATLLGAKRIAVIDNGTPSGRAFADSFVATAKSHGVSIISRDTISDKTSDFNSVLVNARTNNADAIFWGGLTDQAIILALNMHRMNLPMRLISGANGLISGIFTEKAGPAADGAITLEAGQPMEKLKDWKLFEKTYQSAYGSYIDSYAPLAYDATRVLIAAIKKANSLEPRNITRALHDIRFNGMTGVISFNAEGDLNNPTFSIYEFHDQQWRLLQTVGGK